MANCCWIICFLVFSSLVTLYEASSGDSDSLYRACFLQCEKTGFVGSRCLCCNSTSDDSILDGYLYKIKHLHLWWKHLDCQSNCRYHCMLYREKERAELGLEPVKYHGKWPFLHQYGFQKRGLDRKARLFIICCLSWILNYFGNHKKLLLEKWCCQSHGCCSNGCICSYAHFISLQP